MVPIDFIKQCIETYTTDHGYAPKIICVSNEDYVDWHLTCTINSINQFGLKIVVGDYLRAGEFDFAMDIKAGK